MENQQLVSPSRQCSRTQGCFRQVFLSKEKRDNIEVSPIFSWPGCSWYLSVSSTEISSEGTALFWRYGGAEEAPTKWLLWMFPTPLQSLADMYSCTTLNACTILCFSEIKWIFLTFSSNKLKQWCYLDFKTHFIWGWIRSCLLSS